MSTQKTTKLSKTILQMKFMKRTKDKVDKEDEDEQGRLMYSGEITKKMGQNNSNFIIEQSYVPCEDLIEIGRLSYRGMNKEIEQIMKIENGEKLKMEVKEYKNETEVSDKEMAEHYNSLLNTLGKKFDKKGKRKLVQPNNNNTASKRTKFIRPNDDD